MNDQKNAKGSKSGEGSATRTGSPVWWLVFKQEFAVLWIGGRALVLLILFTIVMSVTSVLRELESQLSLIPPNEMVFLTLEVSIAFGLFISLIIGADSISGERERDTLEALLLTPTSRRQIILGKFLVALSPWPAALILSIPYMAVLSQGDEVLGQALLWGVLVGTTLAAAFTAFGMLVSIWSNSNKTSVFISLLVYILLLIPTQWPWQAQVGALGDFIQGANPMESTHHFLEKILVNNRTLAGQWVLLVADVLFATVVLVLLFQYAGPRLRLEGGAPRLILARRRVASWLLIACFIVSLGVAMPIQAATPMAAEQPVQIAIDLDHKVAKTGDKVEFNTTVTNTGTEESPPMVVAMNIINLGSGDPVDPEDWSPERTQEVEPLAPGESVEQSWEVDTILDGDYMVYMTLVPEPESPEATSQPVSSSGIHLTVEAFARSNPGGVLPLAIGMPIALILVTVFLRRRWRRGSSAGGSETAA